MSRRTAKVEELIREEISKLIQSELTEDLGIISVTRSVVTSDLKIAKIYITAVMPEREKEILIALKKKTPDFQRAIGRKIQTRYTPRLSFEFDLARREIDRVEELLGEINRGS